MATILADDIFNCIFLNENDIIPIHNSLKYVLRGPIDNKPALFQVKGDKPFWINNDPVHWRIYAALGGYELNISDLVWFFCVQESAALKL